MCRHQTNAIEAAKANRVKKLFYPSITKADQNNFFLSVMHRAREEILIKSGLPYVILRNNWYVENELDKIKASLKGEPWVTSAGNGKVGYVYRPDLAEATANVLLADGHDNKIYELSGENVTQQQYVAAVNEVTGQKISLLEVDDTTYEKMLKDAGVPEEFVFMTIQSQKGIREGVLEADHSDLATLLEREPTSLREALTQLLQNK
ncbi:MAG: SDR family NAD(P)-dependent oxidoreductase [Bacillales bacterium]